MGNHNAANNNNLNQPSGLLIEDNQQGEDNDARIKSIITVKNPFYLIKETLALEKDAIKKIYYIKFNYDSLVNFDCYINFNVRKDKKRKHLIQKEKHELCYIPSPEFLEKQIIINNLEKGKNKEFYNKDAFFDLDFYEEKHNEVEIKKEDNEEDIFDISIEFSPNYEERGKEYEKNEIIFVSLFELEIKCAALKIKKT